MRQLSQVERGREWHHAPVVHTEPLSLADPHEFVGEWWVPQKANRIVSGRLIYRPGERLRFEAISGHDLRLVGTVPWLNGLTVDGRQITLRTMSIVNMNAYAPGGVLVAGDVYQAIVGMHASSDNDLRFHALHARVSNLATWLDPPGLAVVDGVGAARPSKAPVELGRLPRGLRASLVTETDITAWPKRNPLQLRLDLRAWVTFQGRRRVTWDTLRSTLETFRQFLSLATGVDCPVQEVRVEATVLLEEFGGRAFASREPVWILFHQRTTPHSSPPEPDDLLFRQSDAEFRNNAPLRRWSRRAELMEPVYGLYMAALPTGAMYLQNRFLAFVQALEAYSSRKGGGRPIKLRAVVESAVASLPRKLRRHVPEEFVGVVVDTRNFLTHYNPAKQERAAHGEQLHRLTRATKLIFEIMMLSDLGFQQRQIERLFERNGRLVHEFNFAFAAPVGH